MRGKWKDTEIVELDYANLTGNGKDFDLFVVVVLFCFKVGLLCCPGWLVSNSLAQVILLLQLQPPT